MEIAYLLSKHVRIIENADGTYEVQHNRFWMEDENGRKWRSLYRNKTRDAAVTLLHSYAA